MSQMISIVGRSHSGTPTLIEKLIPARTRRGYRDGTIKHSHPKIDFDKTGKDSWRHQDAGAETVIVASPGKIAMVKNDYRGSLDDLKKFFDDLDLVITEGYKKENKPTIEVVRSARHADALLKADKYLVAVVSDVDLKLEVPIFGLEDIERLADFIEQKYLL